MNDAEFSENRCSECHAYLPEETHASDCDILINGRIDAEMEAAERQRDYALEEAMDREY